MSRQELVELCNLIIRKAKVKPDISGRYDFREFLNALDDQLKECRAEAIAAQRVVCTIIREQGPLVITEGTVCLVRDIVKKIAFDAPEPSDEEQRISCHQ
jgi:hypothetical protein